ncbi:MAG TPA: glycosyltransferase [Thermoanaerobaculia bacterium]|nr:glycosyltransferase [Thermoanaerobaculia bacterium]
MAACFDVIIPARNEASTVAGVVRAALGAEGVGTVFVVDDGSTDETAAVARRAGAEVVLVPASDTPGHKGRALAAGVAASNAGVLVFFDADLTGVVPEHFEELAAPVLGGPFALSCGILSYGPLLDRLAVRLPPITGLRSLKREVFEAVDIANSRGFQIEILINEVVVRRGLPSSVRNLEGLRHRSKVAKRGWRHGLPASLAMWGDLLACLRTVPLWTYPAYLRRLSLLPPAPQLDLPSFDPAKIESGEASPGSTATS